jgi:hypothetical protein
MFVFARIGFHLFRYLPFEIDDTEVIVRAIFSPFRVDSQNKKLKLGAFDPTPGTDDISVMRSSILGAQWCKRKAREFEDPTHKKTFRGFAVLSVRAVRAETFQVVDSRRNNFIGHGDIKTGIVNPPKGVARPPEELARSRDHCKKLVQLSTYRADPFPEDRRWQGEQLIPRALDG